MKELRKKSFEELAGPINQEDDLKFYYHLAELAKEVSQEKAVEVTKVTKAVTKKESKKKVTASK